MLLTRCHSPILPPWKEENFFDLALLTHTYESTGQVIEKRYDPSSTKGGD